MDLQQIPSSITRNLQKAKSLISSPYQKKMISSYLSGKNCPNLSGVLTPNRKFAIKLLQIYFTITNTYLNFSIFPLRNVYSIIICRVEAVFISFCFRIIFIVDFGGASCVHNTRASKGQPLRKYYSVHIQGSDRKCDMRYCNA